MVFLEIVPTNLDPKLLHKFFLFLAIHYAVVCCGAEGRALHTVARLPSVIY